MAHLLFDRATLGDARAGKLANVVFIDPEYSDQAEDMGTSNDYHPRGAVLAAEVFVAQVRSTTP